MTFRSHTDQVAIYSCKLISFLSIVDLITSQLVGPFSVVTGICDYIRSTRVGFEKNHDFTLFTFCSILFCIGANREFRVSWQTAAAITTSGQDRDTFTIIRVEKKKLCRCL